MAEGSGDKISRGDKPFFDCLDEVVVSRALFDAISGQNKFR